MCKEYSKALLHHSPIRHLRCEHCKTVSTAVLIQDERNEINITLAVAKRAFIGSTHKFAVMVCVTM